MKVILRLAAMALLLAAAVARADAPQAQGLKPGEYLHGDYTQERHLIGLAAPMVAEGNFALAPGKGLIWRSTKPFDTIVVITSAGIRQIVGGTEVQRLSATRLPFLTRFYGMVGGALIGDWSAVAKDFNLAQTTDAGTWHIVLTPLKPDDLVAGQLASIAVTGARFATEIEIHRTNGDWERIRILDAAASSDALPQAEAELFADKSP